MYKSLIIFLAVTFAGCTQLEWRKDGTSQKERNQDDYECLQEAEQIVSGPKGYPKGYSTEGTPKKLVVEGFNLDSYNACLASRGYTRHKVKQRTQGKL